MSKIQMLIDGGWEEVVVFENPDYEDALIGVSSDNRAVYDYEKMVESLVKTDEMTWEEAAEFIDYNTVRSLAYQEGAPIIMYPLQTLGEPQGETNGTEN